MSRHDDFVAGGDAMREIASAGDEADQPPADGDDPASRNASSIIVIVKRRFYCYSATDTARGMG
jgi:hypothetical protein